MLDSKMLLIPRMNTALLAKATSLIMVGKESTLAFIPVIALSALFPLLVSLLANGTDSGRVRLKRIPYIVTVIIM